MTQTSKLLLFTIGKEKLTWYQHSVNQSSKLNFEFSIDFNSSNYLAYKFKPEFKVMKYYQELSSESRINLFDKMKVHFLLCIVVKLL